MNNQLTNQKLGSTDEVEYARGTVLSEMQYLEAASRRLVDLVERAEMALQLVSLPYPAPPPEARTGPQLAAAEPVRCDLAQRLRAVGDTMHARLDHFTTLIEKVSLS